MRRALALALLGLAALCPSALAAGPGKVEGIVTPVEVAQEVEVCAVEAQPSESCSVPAANGAYVLSNLSLGPQRVEFLPSARSGLIPQYYNHKNRLSEAATVSLTTSSPTAKNINADLIAGATITGTVTALTGGAALAGVEVCAKSVASPPTRSCAETDPSGEYELRSLLSGSYKIGFWGRGPSAGYQSQYYLAKTSFAQANPVSVTNGAETAGIDVELANGAEVAGTLRAASSGATLPDISVCLFAASGSRPDRCTYSDPAGTYRFQGLASGSYQVGFSLSLGEIGGEGIAGEEDGFLTQYFHGVANRNEAQTITLIAPQASSGIDASLLGPPAPEPPVPPPVVAAAIVPAAPPVAVPPTKKGCKKGYRKQKVKGKTRCVKVHKKNGKGGKKGSTKKGAGKHKK